MLRVQLRREDRKKQNRRVLLFSVVGGGENRTLVLSKLCHDHYMLSALKIAPFPMQSTTLG